MGPVTRTGVIDVATSDFDWERLPAEVCRALARAVSGRPRVGDATAVEILRAQVPIPDEAFLERRAVLDELLELWLPVDPVALERVYATAIEDPPAQLATSNRQRLIRLRRRNRTEKLRGAVLEALLAAGGRAGGLPGVESLRHYLVVPTTGNRPAPLFPYQQKAVGLIRDAARAGTGAPVHGLLVMPTGSGKTKTAVSWLVEDHLAHGRKVLWLTHRVELQQQAALAFVNEASVLRGRRDRLRMRLIGGGYSPATTAAADDFDVAIATIGALRLHPESAGKLLARDDVIVVVDEAHHATAPTWRRLVKAALGNGEPVIGLTATPTRMSVEEREDLSALFGGRVLARVDTRDLINTRYLAQPRIQRVETLVDAEVDLKGSDLDYLKQFGELSPRLAGQLANNMGRNRIIVDTWRRGPGGGEGFGPTIVFAVNTIHAQLLAERFQAAGVAADWLSYTRAGRSEVLEKFRAGALQVVVNVEILTEGVDLPGVQTVFLCRPTQSEVLLSQMVGRALRGPEVRGTELAYLVSFRDHWEQFTEWLDPIDVLPPEEFDPTATPAPAEPEESEQDLGVFVEIPRDLIERAAAEAERAFPAKVGEVYDSVPAGWYSFETETQNDDDEVEVRRHTVFVAQHQLGGYDQFDDAARADAASLDVDGEPLQTRFFGFTANPLPPPRQLELLGVYARENHSLPPRRPIEARKGISPRQVAEGILADDLRHSEGRARIEAAAALAPELVDAFWGGIDGYVEEVGRLLAHHEAHGLWPLDVERHGPYLRSDDRVDFEWGTHSIDLTATLAAVIGNPALFPDTLPQPTGGICWAPTPLRGAWALYEYATQRIIVTPLLDSAHTPEFVVPCLIYHELLHHQDHHLGHDCGPSGHGGDFRDRERRHPQYVEASAWLDSFEDHHIDQRHAPHDKTNAT